MNAALRVTLCAAALALVAAEARSYSLWSTAEDEPGTGEIHLAGESQPLGALRIRNLLLVGPSGWVVPFNNDGPAGHEICSSPPAIERRTNENVDSCPVRLARGELSLFVIEGGPHQGHQMATITSTGELSMSADVVQRLATSTSAPQPFHATTGRLALPAQLAPLAKQIVQRMPWMAAGEGALRGRLGDFNANGWLDGTLVTIGTLPAQRNGAAGEPYLMIRHFETDLPAGGVLSGDVAALARSSAEKRPKATN